MLNVLHIGSHFGNIGDNASHHVVHEAIRRRTPARFQPLEIRRFYANAGELSFDEDFVRHANTFDLVLFGGGNFLEPVHAYSSSATTLDLGPGALAGLRVPFVLNAVGFDPGKGEQEELLERFRTWVGVVADHPRIMVNLRDDGSLADFRRLVGPLDRFGFGLVPDPGLFFRPQGDFPFTDREYVAVNLAGDLEAIRYPEAGAKDSLFTALRGLMAELPEEAALVLIPHVTMDVTLLGEFLRDSSDWDSRKRLLLAPLLQGYEDFWKPFDVYRKAAGIVTNRFHSLLCNLQYEIPMAVLGNYPKIPKTLERMGLTDLLYRGGGTEELVGKLLEDGDETRHHRPALVEKMRKEFETSVDRILAFAEA
jgi:hypothetical protein